MCGITGYFSPGQFITESDLEAMTTSLTHRGPDSMGLFTQGSVGLGNRRLKVIDLSERANQPMHSADGRYVAVYNGMVYNFGEIGAGLVRTGGYSTPHTSCDTEIVLEAFARYGPDFVKMLNGMFVIAIYDKKTDELFIFRDRMGIKPLYYYWDGKNFVFGSELKALRAASSVPKQVNTKAVKDFLHFGYIPAPFSIYRNIFKMKSGTSLRISKNGMEEIKYWDARNYLTENIVSNQEEALVKLSDLLFSSIQYQLKSDVPFGVYLSGGIDSGLIAAKAASLSSVKPNTFTIGFEGINSQETRHAAEVARLLNTRHHEFIVTVSDVMSQIELIPDVFDEPFADSSSVPTLLLSSLSKKHVTVALTGEGGDELFLGYGAYRWAKRLDSVFYKIFRHPVARVFAKMPSRYQRISQLLNYPHGKHFYSHIFSQEQYWFSEAELTGLLKPQYNYDTSLHSGMPQSFLDLYPDGAYVEKDIGSRKLSSMEMQALFDLQFYLQDDLLAKTDRCSMQHAIEARVPFLDHRVVEYSLNLAPDLKFRNGTPKYILNRILYKYLPEEMFKRPKEGFDIPLNKWLRKELNYLVEENLNDKVVNGYGIVEPAVVKDLINRFDAGSEYLYNRIWLLIILHKWFRRFEPLS